jgi:hypothetical protein
MFSLSIDIPFLRPSKLIVRIEYRNSGDLIMKVYTYSQARQKLAKILDELDQNEKAIIKRRDGRSYELKSIKEDKSPLDLESVDVDISITEVNDIYESTESEAKIIYYTLPFARTTTLQKNSSTQKACLFRNEHKDWSGGSKPSDQ